MSSPVAEHCQSLVRLLENDIGSMCNSMLLDENRDAEKANRYFQRLREHESLLLNMLSGLTLQMRTCHNALNPVVHLPDAIFRRILIQSVMGLPPKDRLFIGQVCSHWRKRAMEVRSIWAGVDLHWKQLTKEYLQRSEPLPIDVKFETPSYYDIEEMDFQDHFNILKPHMHRLHTFTFKIPKPLLSASLKILCCYEAPLLEQLVVKGDDDNGMINIQDGTEPVADTLELFGQRTPKLNELYFKGVYISWSSSIFKNLTILKIDRCSVLPPNTNLLKVLRSCPDLEALHISKTRAISSGIDDCYPQDDEIVQLPHLRVLNLQYIDAPELRRILWRLDIPAGTSMTISSCLDDIYTTHDVFPPQPHRLRNISAMKSLAVTIGPRTSMRGTMYSHGGRLLFQADLTCVDLTQSADMQIRSITQTVPFANLERLSISAKHCARGLARDLACNVLREAPTILYLTVVGLQPHDVLACLLLETVERMVTFECSDIKFHEMDLTSWLSRNKSVRMQLTSLEFCRCTGISAAHIEQFRAMVPEVSWDDEGLDFPWPKSIVLECNSRSWT